MFEIFTTVTYSSGYEYVSVDGKTPHCASTHRLSSAPPAPAAPKPPEPQEDPTIAALKQIVAIANGALAKQ